MRTARIACSSGLKYVSRESGLGSPTDPFIAFCLRDDPLVGQKSERRFANEGSPLKVISTKDKAKGHLNKDSTTPYYYK
jgi:hypothetical protein